MAASFSSSVKEELAHVEPECSHCEKATLAALVRIEGTLFLSGTGTYRMEVATDSASVARLVIRLLHGLYQLKTDLTVRRSVLHKTPNYLIEVPRQPALADALQDLGILTADGGLELGISPSLVRKQCDAAAYLRGAFLGSGFISNPRSDFHFEIMAETQELAEGLQALMALKGISARIMQRRSSFMVYLKSGEAIMEFLAYVGAHQAALFMEEQRVVKSLRNDVSRSCRRRCRISSAYGCSTRKRPSKSWGRCPTRPFPNPPSTTASAASSKWPRKPAVDSCRPGAP